MTDKRPDATPEECAVEHEVPGYPGLYIKRTRTGGAALYARWARPVEKDDWTFRVGGLGPYLNESTIGREVEDVVEAVRQNVEEWFGWPHHFPASDLELAKNWTPPEDSPKARDDRMVCEECDEVMHATVTTPGFDRTYACDRCGWSVDVEDS